MSRQTVQKLNRFSLQLHKPGKHRKSSHYDNPENIMKYLK